MNKAKFRIISKKVLDIYEILEGDSDPIVVTLKKCGPLGVPLEQVSHGIMRWKDPAACKNRRIDLVQAVFSSKGQAGDQGSVKLKIKLKGGLQFNEEPVSKVPTLDPTITERTLRCIEYKVDEDNRAVITITFLEPKEGEVVTYPVIYFLTNNVDKEDFIIDPGLGAIRIPP